MVPSPRTTGAAGALAALVAVLLPLLLYLRTMAPTVYGLDSAELTAGACVLGIVHAPGSPLYLLLGHLFTWLPFGDVGYRVNLLSACSAALAAGFLYATLRRLTLEPLLALAGALYVATTYYFWVSAVAAELYALHATFITFLLWLALCWFDRPRAPLLYALCLLYGVGLTNHLSLVVLAPGFAFIVLSGLSDPLRRWPTIATAALCVGLGWSLYLYLPLRAANGVAMNYARDFGVDVTTLRGFWWMVTGSMFDAELLGVTLSQLPLEVLRYFYQLWSNFLGLGCILGFVGLATDFRRRRRIHTTLALMFGGHLAFVLTYSVGDKDLMLLPTFIIWGIWATLGAARAAELIATRSRGAVAVSGAALLALMAVSNVALNFSRVDIAEDWSARNRGEVLLSWLPRDTLYLATWADAPIIDYMQYVESWRPDVKLVNVFLVRGVRRQRLVEDWLVRGLPVYATAPVGLGRGYLFELDPSCDCYWVKRRDRNWSPAPPPPTYQSHPTSWDRAPGPTPPLAPNLVKCGTY